jgi:TetR/AcrR family transcriptional regulator
MSAAAEARARPSGRQARKNANRRNLVEAAERVFASRGYERTHMQHIAAEAGLSTATVYALCSSKDALYAEVHRARGRMLLLAATSATVGVRSAWEALLAGVRAYTNFLLEHADYLKLHLEESQPWALSPRFTTAEQSKLWRDGLQLTVEVFRSAIEEGTVVDEDPALLARLMIAAHQVFLGEWVEQGMREQADAVVARMHAHLERAFGTGRAPRKHPHKTAAG